MVGVGQHQRGTQFVQLGGGERLDGGLRADRRKDRRFQVAVRGVEETGTRAALGGQELVFEHGRDYKGRMEQGEVPVNFPRRDMREKDTLKFREPLVFALKCLYNYSRIQKGYDLRIGWVSRIFFIFRRDSCLNSTSI